MTKENIEKLLVKKNALLSTDLTADEKRGFFAFLQPYDISQAFFYDRFFKEGFCQWEIDGIDNIKTRFLLENGLDLDGMEVPGVFFATIGEHRGLKAQFARQMSDLGMMSPLTVQSRFVADNWKAWERMGIHSLVSQFLASYPDVSVD